MSYTRERWIFYATDEAGIAGFRCRARRQRLTTDGRVFFVLTGEGRKPAKTDPERVELLDTLVAYSGTYTLDGDQWITSVEVAWNPEWVGTKQARAYKFEGVRLTVMTPWRVMPNWADKGHTRSIVTFERAK